MGLGSWCRGSETKHQGATALRIKSCQQERLMFRQTSCPILHRVAHDHSHAAPAFRSSPTAVRFTRLTVFRLLTKEVAS